ncbi:MAG: hypothetical protein NZZ60_00365 [Bacteroidia bacterium]|nr:hypothetical protein [Bacteroidia bacterium]MDW8417243.1 hypothetical protein [Bacteroidia bacterium]
MRFYLVSATTQVRWERRVRSSAVPALVGCTGPLAPTVSKQLSAAFSELGIPNRWLPMRRRPELLEKTVSAGHWQASVLSQLQQETPIIILDAEDSQLRTLWDFLRISGEIEDLYFMPAHLIPTTIHARTLSDLREWAAADEALQKDFLLAANWLPCTLTPMLS